MKGNYLEIICPIALLLISCNSGQQRSGSTPVVTGPTDLRRLAIQGRLSPPEVFDYLNTMKHPISNSDLSDLVLMLENNRVPGVREEFISMLATNSSSKRDSLVLGAFSRRNTNGLTMAETLAALFRPRSAKAEQFVKSRIRSKNDEEKMTAMLDLLPEKKFHSSICAELAHSSNQVKLFVKKYASKYKFTCQAIMGLANDEVGHP
jgi:hypothetical protein